MKDKTDVLQGTLALMVLKTLDVLGPLHGYGIARRIEQISGELLTVNQGTLYPVLLKLEQEGSIASEWGASENNRKARFYRLTRDGRKQLRAEAVGLGTDGRHHRAILRREGRGSEMRTVRRFFTAARRLDDQAGAEERLRAEIEDHLALQTAENVRAGLSPVEARRQAVLKFGGSRRDQRTLAGATRTAGSGNAVPGHAPRAATLANGPGVHDRDDADAGAGHRRDHLDLHAGACRSVEVAAGRESRRAVPPGKGSALLLLGRLQPGTRVFARLLPALYAARDRHRASRSWRPSRRPGPPFGVRRCGQRRSEPKAIRASSSLAITSRCSAYRAYAGRTLGASRRSRRARRPSAVMSYRLWKQRYRSAPPSIVGSVFNLNDKPFTVVGITPPGFFGDTLRSAPPDFFLPLNTEPLVTATGAHAPRHSLVGVDRPHPARRIAGIRRGRDAGRAQAVAALALG